MTESKLQSVEAYSRLHEDILNSKFPPKHKLKVKELSEDYNIGIIPIREALSKLASEELVSHVGQTGFTVSELSKGEFRSLIKTTILIESIAIELSIENYNFDWEEDLVLGFHRLKRTERILQVDNKKKMNPKWILYHNDFHINLVKNSGLPWLNKFCGELQNHRTKYVTLIGLENPNLSRDDFEEHQNIFKAVIDKDIKLSKKILQEHYEISLRHILKFLD
jgi:DNA-binding GntR family transcriptional regulator